MTQQTGCPLLKAQNVADSEAGYGSNKNWIKDVCTTCPLPNCLLELKGKARKEAEEKLEQLVKDAIKSIGGLNAPYQ